MSDFAATRWTLVAQARGNDTESKAALSELCDAYYKPVVAFLACEGRTQDAARELAHQFFATILAGKSLSGAERGRGRFRSYVLGAVKHFLADTRDRLGAAKRGAQHEHTPLTTGTDTSPGLEIPAAPPPDAWFDRQWGLAVLALALASLAAEHAQQGKAQHFQLLKPWLTGDGGTQSAVAAQLGMSEGAVKVAIHRLRKRFRDLVKAEIAQTVSTDDEAREELRYLIEVVS